jgi:hypothetical protein
VVGGVEHEAAVAEQRPQLRGAEVHPDALAAVLRRARGDPELLTHGAADPVGANHVVGVDGTHDSDAIAQRGADPVRQLDHHLERRPALHAGDVERAEVRLEQRLDVLLAPAGRRGRGEHAELVARRLADGDRRTAVELGQRGALPGEPLDVRGAVTCRLFEAPASQDLH